MNRIRLFIWAAPLMLVACSSVSNKGTIADLRHVHIEIKEEKIEGGLEKAMQSYQRFLEETPDSALTPEAIRRLADLKLEKEYGTLTTDVESAGQAPASPAPERAAPPKASSVAGRPSGQALANVPAHESEAEFERRATRRQPMAGMAAAANTPGEGADDLDRAGTRDAIALYKKLLNDYPLYKHNDEVLYQMSRAYEELGQTEEAMAVMDRVVRDFPRSRYIDEVQFRRAEYFFVHRRYLDAEDAYKSVVDIGAGSPFYELALYKLGWTFYKQELYEDALRRFIALMDHKVSEGYDFEQTEDEQERKRTEDTFRVISLSFSNLGGADAAVQYFSRHGKRSYEDRVYSNLGEFYFAKRRYADAAAAYNAFVSRNPFHKMAPNFQMRVIEIQAAGGFPSLVLDAKKKFASTYSLKAEYWKYFDPSDRPDVLGFLKTNLTDLAHHYHACYQDPRQAEDKAANFQEAVHWYRAFLSSFPTDTESPVINYQLADLLLENRSFGKAAVEFEKTAYGYPRHDKSSQAGYAAVSAYREQLGAVSPEDEDVVKREVVRSSLRFADTFPQHEKAAVVLGAAADDLYGMKEYEQALAAEHKLLEAFPDTDVDVTREAWLVIGHSSYELSRYGEAETAYQKVLALLPAGDETRDALMDNLAASIYKQGEQANAAHDYRAAADHFLRVGRMAPTSKIRPTAEYDAAVALIKLKDWDTAASVLVGFRNNYPENPLQSEVTKKLAYVYKENNQLSLAANEYERIERESQDDEVRRDALLVAAELHEKDGNSARALEVYRRYVGYFPQPVEPNLEARNKIAEILKAQNERKAYLDELEKIVAIDASAGSERTPRTRYLAAQAALVLAQRDFDAFAAVKLVKPFEVNLHRKRELMKTAIQKFSHLMDYEIGETTAAATFYLAEIYAHFSKALMTSERPEGLSSMEREQYELAIEEQAYPFEEKAIHVHESNLKLISRGVYNVWVEKSLQKLAKSVPARYDRPEESSGIISSLGTYVFAIDRPAPPKSEVARTEKSGTTEPTQAEKPGAVTEPETAEPSEAQEPSSVTETETAEPAQAEKPEAVTEPETEKPAQAEEPEAVTEPETEKPAQAEEPEAVTETEAAEPTQAEEPGAVPETETAEPTQVEEPGAVPETETAEPTQVEEPEAVTEPETAEPVQAEKPEAVTETAEPTQSEEPGAVTEPETAEPTQVEEPEAVTEPETAEPAEGKEPGAVTEPETAEPAQGDHTGVSPTRTEQATGR
ncbi:MAG: tetratricopeptide repeat protein [Nitrospirota bacterium]